MKNSLNAALIKRASLILLLGLSLTNFIACGKNAANSIISDINVKTTLVNNEVVMDLSAIFDLGNLSMSAVQVSIINPDDPSLEYGEFRIMPTLDFKNEIGIKVNLTDAAGVPGSEATLPNGSALPIGGLSGVDILQLRLAQMDARIYLALNKSTFLFGFALPIKEFDQVSRYVGAVNIFPGFSIKGVRGIVGIFTGQQTNTSGLGFFLDLSSVISPDVLNTLINGMGPKLSQKEFDSMAAVKATTASSKLDFTKGMNASSSKMNKAYNILTGMKNGKAQTLHYLEK